MYSSTTSASLRSHTAVASGFLHKLAHNRSPFSRWHQHYYVLYTDGLLCSYKSSRARNSHRVIPVGRNCLRVRFGTETRSDECSRWPKDFPRELCFSIINSDRQFHFHCETEREFEMWRENLLQTLGKLGSAHTSYVERGSKLNGITRWLEGNSDNPEDDSYAVAIGGKRELERQEQKVEGETEGEKEWGEDSEGSVEGYDLVGSASAEIMDEVEGSGTEQPAERVSRTDGHDDADGPPEHELADLAERGSLGECEDTSNPSTSEGAATFPHVTAEPIECEEVEEDKNTTPEKEWELDGDEPVDVVSGANTELNTENQARLLATPQGVATKAEECSPVTGSYSSRRGIDLAFLEVQNIIDELSEMF